MSPERPLNKAKPAAASGCNNSENEDEIIHEEPVVDDVKGRMNDEKCDKNTGSDQDSFFNSSPVVRKKGIDGVHYNDKTDEPECKDRF